MSRLTRKYQAIFANKATNNGVFGSLQTGNKQTSNDPEVIQSLPAYDQGWNAATISSEELPPLEELQGIEYVNSYQVAYLLQEGMPEWNAATTYYVGGMVKVLSGTEFKLYFSKTDDNIGNDPATSADNWYMWFDSAGSFVTTSGSQDITGEKTFLAPININRPGKIASISFKNLETSGAEPNYGDINWCDTSNNRLMDFRGINDSATSRKIQFSGFDNQYLRKSIANIGINNNVPYVTVPNPPSNSNGDNAATTSWVINRSVGFPHWTQGYIRITGFPFTVPAKGTALINGHSNGNTGAWIWVNGHQSGFCTNTNYHSSNTVTLTLLPGDVITRDNTLEWYESYFFLNNR